MDIDTIKTTLPKFPDLNLDEFIIYDQMLTESIKRNYCISSDVKIGGQTIEFIEMFFKDAKSVLRNITNEYLDNETAFKKDLINVKLLKQENLNHDFKKFLLENKYTMKEVQIIDDIGKSNVTQKPEVEISEAVRLYNREYERLLYHIFKSSGITYN